MLGQIEPAQGKKSETDRMARLEFCKLFFLVRSGTFEIQTPFSIAMSMKKEAMDSFYVNMALAVADSCAVSGVFVEKQKIRVRKYLDTAEMLIGSNKKRQRWFNESKLLIKRRFKKIKPHYCY